MLFPSCNFQINSSYSQTYPSSAKFNLYWNYGSQRVNTNEIKWIMAIYFCPKQISLQLSQAEKLTNQGANSIRVRRAFSTPNLPGRWGQPGVNKEPVKMEEISVWEGCGGPLCTLLEGTECRCSGHQEWGAQVQSEGCGLSRAVGTWWAAAHHGQGCLQGASERSAGKERSEDCILF